ncbi:urease accessory protein UreF [Izhakiella australiensis]|uniref:Urease accessory protein UreF n=1 Tax=Izhakiella australiensis TaxID=1926881 RepID=A0A1S8YSV0_9GAMM|nr:urease accessory UreF family protein [Izhakiella australiensis]OON41906.1 urease accessory protein UreF [Izhakiella australiensis]
MNALRLIRIMQFGDSVLPVGAFAFSNGIESAIQCGVVNNLDSLRDFTRQALQQAASGDVRATVCCCRALSAGDRQAVLTYDHLLFNRKLNAESRVMVTRMGKKLAEIAVLTCDDPLLAWWLAQIKEGKTPGSYPISQAVVMSAMQATPRDVAVISLYGVAVTLLSAALRLMRVTHLETQRILFEVLGEMESLCNSAEQGGIEQMASWAPATDVLAAMHVAAWTRLFSS